MGVYLCIGATGQAEGGSMKRQELNLLSGWQIPAGCAMPAGLSPEAGLAGAQTPSEPSTLSLLLPFLSLPLLLR